MIFAVGGGKAIDTCKLVSIDFEKPYFSFPTIDRTVHRLPLFLLYIMKTGHFASLCIS